MLILNVALKKNMMSKIVFSYLSLVCIQELYQYDMFLVMKNNTFVRQTVKPKIYALNMKFLSFQIQYNFVR